MRTIYVARKSFLSRIKDIAITGICATLVVKNEMTIGEMMTISYIVGNLSSPFSTIIGLMSTMQNASMSYQRLEEIIESKNLEKEKMNVAGSDFTIRFDNVSFKLCCDVRIRKFCSVLSDFRV